MIQVIRQGDICFVRVDRHPSAKAIVVNREGGRVVIAHGEITGHAHACTSPTSVLYEEPNGERLLVVGDQDVIKHEEHGPQTLEKGVWEIKRQREYFPKEIREVQD